METATPVLKALCTMYGIPEFQCLDAEGLDDIRNDKEALHSRPPPCEEPLASVLSAAPHLAADHRGHHRLSAHGGGTGPRPGRGGPGHFCSPRNMDC